MGCGGDDTLRLQRFGTIQLQQGVSRLSWRFTSLVRVQLNSALIAHRDSQIFLSLVVSLRKEIDDTFRPLLVRPSRLSKH